MDYVDLKPNCQEKRFLKNPCQSRIITVKIRVQN
jgi:hypothetical protein